MTEPSVRVRTLASPREALGKHERFGGAERNAGEHLECPALLRVEMTFSRGSPMGAPYTKCMWETPRRRGKSACVFRGRRSQVGTPVPYLKPPLVIVAYGAETNDIHRNLACNRLTPIRVMGGPGTRTCPTDFSGLLAHGEVSHVGRVESSRALPRPSRRVSPPRAD